MTKKKQKKPEVVSKRRAGHTLGRMKYTQGRTLLKETELPVREKPTVRNNIKPDTQTLLLHEVRSTGKEFVYQVFLYAHQNKPKVILCR